MSEFKVNFKKPGTDKGGAISKTQNAHSFLQNKKTIEGGTTPSESLNNFRKISHKAEKGRGSLLIPKKNRNPFALEWFCISF